MRSVLAGLFGLCLVVVVPDAVAAQDISGTWSVVVDLNPGGGGPITLVLEQYGTDVSGTYTGTYGSLVPLAGTYEGGRISVSFDSDQLGEIAFEGTVIADTMRGSVAYGTDIGGTFEGLLRPPATIVSTYVAYSVMALLVLLALSVLFRRAPRPRG